MRWRELSQEGRFMLAIYVVIAPILGVSVTLGLYMEEGWLAVAGISLAVCGLAAMATYSWRLRRLRQRLRVGEQAAYPYGSRW